VGANYVHKDVLIVQVYPMDFLNVQLVITIMDISSAKHFKIVQLTALPVNIGMDLIFNVLIALKNMEIIVLNVLPQAY